MQARHASDADRAVATESKLQAELDAALTALNDAEDRVAATTAELAAARREATAAAATAAADLKRERGATAEARADATRAEQQLEAARVAEAGLRDEVADLRKATAERDRRVRSQALDQGSTITTLQEQVRGLERRLQEALDAKVAIEGERTTLRHTVSEARAAALRAEAQGAALADRLEAVRKALDDRELRVQDLEGELATRNREAAGLQEEVTTLSEQLRALRKERDGLQLGQEDLQGQLERQTSARIEAEARIEELDAGVAAAERSAKLGIAEANAEAAAKAREADLVGREVIALEATVQRQLGTIDDLRASNVTLHERVTSAVVAVAV